MKPSKVIMELFEKYRKKYVFKSFDECKFFEAIEDVEQLEAYYNEKDF